MIGSFGTGQDVQIELRSPWSRTKVPLEAGARNYLNFELDSLDETGSGCGRPLSEMENPEPGENNTLH